MVNDERCHRDFLQSGREHVLMLTIHGVHEWQVVPGLQDTGGQNVFVNQFSAALCKHGYKVTIVNRGGYPHPRSGVPQTGVHYLDGSQRILYLEDGTPAFVRKEDMGDQLPGLLDSLTNSLECEESKIDLIISHYWDAGMLGNLFARSCALGVKHVWVPHSLGEVKKRNLSPDMWGVLRVDDRIRYEKEIFSKIDFLAATSSIIKTSAIEDYGYTGRFLWLPPCVDQERYYPRDVDESDPIWKLLSDASGMPLEEIQKRKIVTEISRTDVTKQKDILIKAFAKVHQEQPETFLVLSIDRTNGLLADELLSLIKEKNLNGSVAPVGSIWEELPALYAITDVYCTPSIMEGFGMSVQEAAASQVPVVSSDLVPFVTEYLAGDSPEKITLASGTEIINGSGAMIVPPGAVEGYIYAINKLLSDDELRQEKGYAAYHAAIPYFTWDHIVQDFTKGIDKSDDV